MSDSISLQSVTTAELSTQIREKMDAAYANYRAAIRRGDLHVSEEAWNSYGRIEDAKIRLDRALQEAMYLLDTEN